MIALSIVITLVRTEIFDEPPVRAGPSRLLSPLYKRNHQFIVETKVSHEPELNLIIIEFNNHNNGEARTLEIGFIVW